MQKSTFSYDEAVLLLTSQGKFHINLGLERIKQLLEHFGNPQDRIQCVHVAGTNGKGSTCAMLASVLSEAGLKTGLYTSPHLVRYTERIKINNVEISPEEFAELIYTIIEYADRKGIPATEFEILTAAGFIYFDQKKVDLAVIETGLGGRLDASNVIKHPLMSIITNIDLDHTSRLGSTIEEISFEKAGIIKQNNTLVTLENNNGLEIIKNKCDESGTKIFLAKEEDSSSFELGLLGLWQKKNASLAIKAIKILNKKGFCIPEKAIKEGLKNVKWSARFEYIKERNTIIDAAHNPSGAKALKESLDNYFPDQERIFIYSSLNTKDFKGVINSLFRENDSVIITKSSCESSLDPYVIKNYLDETGICKKSYVAENIEEAINLSEKIRKPSDLIVISGSIYTIGEFLKNNKKTSSPER